MKIEEHLPAKLLRPFVKAYNIIESEDMVTNRVLPNSAVAMAFRFRGKNAYLNDKKSILLPTATLSGLRRSVRLIHYLPNTSTIVVLFKEAGASAFFKVPLHELYEKSISLDSIFSPTEVSITEEKLSEAKNNPERISIIEQFLVSKLCFFEPDYLVAKAIAEIYATKETIRMKALANTVCMSQDAFEKRFRKAVGTTPKKFASIVRMKAVVKQTKKHPSFTDLALENGFFDQAHFNKDFKQFTGLSPTEFFKTASFW